jgi:hypothetical protein
MRAAANTACAGGMKWDIQPSEWGEVGQQTQKVLDRARFSSGIQIPESLSNTPGQFVAVMIAG